MIKIITMMAIFYASLAIFIIWVGFAYYDLKKYLGEVNDEINKTEFRIKWHETSK